MKQATKKEVNVMSQMHKFLSALWVGRQKETGHSWRILNESMREALFLACRCGLQFGKDLEELSSFRWGYWIGVDGVEHLYACAIEHGNASAWKAIEAHLGRAPFIIPWARYKRSQSLARVPVGASFEWQGVTVEVTSIKADALVACSYAAVHEWPRKPLKRFSITRDDIKAEKKRRAGPVAEPAL